MDEFEESLYYDPIEGRSDTLRLDDGSWKCSGLTAIVAKNCYCGKPATHAEKSSCECCDGLASFEYFCADHCINAYA